MFQMFANIFGYLLEIIYKLTNNYGLAIIFFTILIKILFIPFSVKQQRTMKKSAKIQEKMKVIQFKYKNDPEKMNQEVMELYKNEKQIIELELDNEKKYLESIMKQGSSLAKIRHDIADQLFVIKNIAQDEPERAYTMMQQLEDRITKEIEMF